MVAEAALEVVEGAAVVVAAEAVVVAAVVVLEESFWPGQWDEIQLL